MGRTFLSDIFDGVEGALLLSDWHSEPIVLEEVPDEIILKEIAWRRFKRGFVIDPISGCWNWKNPSTAGKYGTFNDWRGRKNYAHRFSFEIANGYPCPAGLVVDHICHNEACVNPNHLQAISLRDNYLRSPKVKSRVRILKSHCRNGHEFTDANIYHDPRGHRGCRTCRHEATKRWYDSL